MLTIYFHNLFRSFPGFGSKERLYAPSGYHLDTISYSNVAILFYSENGVGVQNDSPWKKKLLEQFDCTTCLDVVEG